MSDFFLGEIRMFGFAWAPQSWALCNGAVMPVQQNAALNSLLGSTYGGDGRTTFNLPDLRGRTPLAYTTSGTCSQGLSVYAMGAKTGTETVALTTGQMAGHTHATQGVSGVGTTGAISGNYLATVAPTGTDPNPIYAVPQSPLAINPGTVGTSGTGAPHPNMQPFTVMNFCISTVGIYPTRP